MVKEERVRDPVVAEMRVCWRDEGTVNEMAFSSKEDVVSVFDVSADV